MHVLPSDKLSAPQIDHQCPAKWQIGDKLSHQITWLYCIRDEIAELLCEKINCKRLKVKWEFKRENKFKWDKICYQMQHSRLSLSILHFNGFEKILFWCEEFVWEWKSA